MKHAFQYEENSDDIRNRNLTSTQLQAIILRQFLGVELKNTKIKIVVPSLAYPV